ncbi:MAG: hypothetical protein VYA32_10255 [Planctomycetota bacterium]|nr:hypothetical protein [Planctomycetota bacterium]MEC9008083.1 hypothetical protein [Planctomycetota bacterium]
MPLRVHCRPRCVAWKFTSISRSDGSSSGLRFRCSEQTIVGSKAAHSVKQICSQLQMGVAR